VIELAPPEVALPLQTLTLPPEFHRKLKAAAGQTLLLQGQESDVLLELVTDRLRTHGFDGSYRPTEEGKALEALVDRLSAPEYDPS